MFLIINHRDLCVAMDFSHEAESFFHQKGCETAFLMRCNCRLLSFQARLVDF